MDTRTSSRLRTPPERSPDFAHLSLDALRRYRATLSAEESRVSYWRRIVQARLDVVRATEDGAVPASSALHDVLARPRMETSRQALMELLPVDDMPPLPNLADLWERASLPGNAKQNHRLIRDLSKAETQLSKYRAALHQRIAAATTELIARYREDPTQCFRVLPLQPGRDSRAVGA